MSQQYLQNVDNSVWVGRPSLVPGLRGRAYPIGAYPDWLTEGPLGGIAESNKGFPWTYLPKRIASFTPALQVTNTYVNGRFVSTQQGESNYNFHAQAIRELNVSSCT